MKAICEEQGLKEITFKAQKRAWKWQSDKYDVKTWIIEAVTPADLTSFQSEQMISEDKIFIEGYIERTSRAPKKMLPLPREGTIRYTARPKAEAKDVEFAECQAEASTEVPSSQENQEEQAADGQRGRAADADGTAKRARSDRSRSRERKERESNDKKAKVEAEQKAGTGLQAVHAARRVLAIVIAIPLEKGGWEGEETH